MSGTNSQQTSFSTPPKSTVAIRVPSFSQMFRTAPGTARHMMFSPLGGSGWRGCGGDDELADGQAGVAGWNLTVMQHGEAVVLQTLQAEPGEQDVEEDPAGQ